MQRLQCGVKTEEAIEVDRAALCRLARRTHSDRATARVVRLLTERHHHVETIDGAALEDADQRLLALRRAGLRQQRTLEKLGWHTQRQQSQRATAYEHSAMHCFLYVVTS